MMTTSVAVQAPRASSTSSIGPGALFDPRSESTVIAFPEGLVATNFCLPIHFTDPVCMRPPRRKHSRTANLKRARQIPIGFRFVFWFKFRSPTGSLHRVRGERTNANLKGKAPAGDSHAWTGGAAMVNDSRSRNAAERHGRRWKRSTVRD